MEEDVVKTSTQLSSELSYPSPTFDELDDDLLNCDFDDLGEVLDELAKENIDTDIAEELKASTDSNEGTQKDGLDVASRKADGAVKPKKSDGAVGSDKVTGKASSSSQKTLLESPPVNDEDEIEDGEIREDDEKDELRELYKRKTEIVNKMKKLVRHKIQLTTQRNNLLLQLKADTHLDKVNTLLKENSLLVKAISNQIFRMNPEIKIINGKIKELQSSIGSAHDAEGQKAEGPPSQFAASKKDVENVENFFNRLSSVIETNKKEKVENFFNRLSSAFEKNQTLKEKTAAVVKQEKEPVKSLQPESAADDAKKKTVSFRRNRIITKISFDQADSTKDDEPAVGFKKNVRLTGDNNKIKKLFERVCEMNERNEGTASGGLENTAASSSEKATDISHERRREKTSDLQCNISKSLENSIDMKLKEIRFNTTSKSPVKVELIDLTSSSKKNAPTKTPMTTSSGGSLHSDNIDKSIRKPKRLIQFNNNEPSTSNTRPNKMIKLTNTSFSNKGENTAANSISKSLYQRLGTTPNDGKRVKVTPGNVITNRREDANNAIGEDMYSNIPVNVRENKSQGKRQAFWCGYCHRPFKAIEVYVAHLESPKHLTTALEMRSKRQSGDVTYNDGTAAEASKDTDDVSWFKGDGSAFDRLLRAQLPNDVYQDTQGSAVSNCIQPLNFDSFCQNKALDSLHSHCVEHAKCVVMEEDRIFYNPVQCDCCKIALEEVHTKKNKIQYLFDVFNIIYLQNQYHTVSWHDLKLLNWLNMNKKAMMDDNRAEEQSKVSDLVRIMGEMEEEGYKWIDGEIIQLVRDENGVDSVIDTAVCLVPMYSPRIIINKKEQYNLAFYKKNPDFKESERSKLLNVLVDALNLVKDKRDILGHTAVFDLPEDSAIVKICNDKKILYRPEEFNWAELFSNQVHSHFVDGSGKSDMIMDFVSAKDFESIGTKYIVGGETLLDFDQKCVQRLNNTKCNVKCLTDVHIGLLASCQRLFDLVEEAQLNEALENKFMDAIESIKINANQLHFSLKVGLHAAAVEMRKVRYSAFKIRPKKIGSLMSLIKTKPISGEIFSESDVMKADKILCDTNTQDSKLFQQRHDEILNEDNKLRKRNERRGRYARKGKWARGGRGNTVGRGARGGRGATEDTATGDIAIGDMAIGGIATGDMAKGGIATGDMAKGGIATGDMAKGSMATGGHKKSRGGSEGVHSVSSVQWN